MFEQTIKPLSYIKSLFIIGLLVCICSCSTTKTYKVNGVSFDMVKVKGGAFDMGAADNQSSESHDVDYPVHNVTLDGFQIGKTEVTQKLWTAVMGYNPSTFIDDDKPVENVSWTDCIIFIQKLNDITNCNFRLPTDAEWEFAARGGRKSKHYKYAGSDDLNEVAWNINNSNKTSHKVATKSPNELGIYDMSGNVWEWCDDWFYEFDKKATRNPVGRIPSQYKIDRGGGWNRLPRCITSYRGRDVIDYRDSNLGFRLAR